MFVKFWKIPEITRAVEFIFTEVSAIRFYPRSFNKVRPKEQTLLKSPGESDRQVIVITAGSLREGAESLLLQQAVDEETT